MTVTQTSPVATADVLGVEETVGALLAYRAAADPDVEYIVSSERRMTFAEAGAASALLARRMLARGIGKGTRVGLLFSYSHEFVIWWLAASRIGAVAIPLSTLYTSRELGQTIPLADIHTLITAPQVVGKDNLGRLADALPGLATATVPELRLLEAPFLREIWLTEDGGVPWARGIDSHGMPDAGDPGPELLAAAERRVTPADLAVVVFTSGSSAAPKGVVHTHGTLVRSSGLVGPTMRGYAGVNPPKVFCGMPFFWIGGLTSLTGALLDPVTLLIAERPEPAATLELLERERGTHVLAWPTFIQRLRSHPDFATRDVSSAPRLISGPVDVATINIPVPGASMHRSLSEISGSFVGVEAKIIDPDTGAELPAGVDGELLVRGDGVMTGYYGLERSEVFDADGWYHTGDKCLKIDGDPRVFYRGRFTEMIKAAGANVAPAEVEQVIGELPDVEHCFVVGTADAERQQEVTAVIVPADASVYDQARVSAHARASLSAYKVPTRWILITARKTPWLGSGKPDKKMLRQWIESGELQ